MDITMKSLVSFEVVKEDRQYKFIMPAACPAGEAYDVLYEFLNKVVKISQENVKAMERSSEPVAKVEN